MDCTVLISRLGRQIRETRIRRGLTQARLGELAGLTRQKVIAVEKGTQSVAMNAYARALSALDCELAVVPAAMPTLEELQELFE
ncbi:anaerobic benzoate catabolism transcriptional regulator [compost metagenome]